MIGLLLLEWALLLVMVYGLGLLLQRLLGAQASTARSYPVIFWSGFGGLLFILQVWHLYRPIDSSFSFLMVILAAIGWLAGRQYVFPLRIRSSINFGLLLLPFAFWIAVSGLSSIIIYDAGLYHFQTISWNLNYPVVPGLGNLHGRLGLHSTYYLYCAFLERWSFFHFPSQHLANGLLMLGGLMPVLARVDRLWRKRATIKLSDVYLALMVWPLILQNDGVLLSSQSADFCVYTLQFIAGYLFLTIVERVRADRHTAVGSLLVVLLAGITVKVSFLFFAVFMFAGLGIILARYKQGVGIKLRTIILMSAVMVPWGINQCILSGYLFYCSTWVSFPVPWRVPECNARDLLSATMAWARIPAIHYSLVLNDSRWMAPWLAENYNNLWGFRLPLLLASGTHMLAAGLYLSGRRRPVLAGVWCLNLLLLASLAVWFNGAPDVRFAGALLWMLAAAGVLLAVNLGADFGIFFKGVLSLDLLLILYALYAAPMNVPMITGIIPNTAYPKDRYYQYTTSSGLKVNVPRCGDQCWGAPLPCTPYPVRDLHLIRPGDLGSGFISRQKNLMY